MLVGGWAIVFHTPRSNALWVVVTAVVVAMILMAVVVAAVTMAMVVAMVAIVVVAMVVVAMVVMAMMVVAMVVVAMVVVAMVVVAVLVLDIRYQGSLPVLLSSHLLGLDPGHGLLAQRRLQGVEQLKTLRGRHGEVARELPRLPVQIR